MAKVIIYTTAVCPYCHMAKELLQARNIAYEEIRIDLDDTKRQEMMERSQRRSVPQIFINDQPIGGYDDLALIAKSGRLDELLTNS